MKRKIEKEKKRREDEYEEKEKGKEGKDGVEGKPDSKKQTYYIMYYLLAYIAKTLLLVISRTQMNALAEI